MSNETTTTYLVEGMSWGHRQAAVREEVEQVDGVEAMVDDSAVRSAIDDGGYEAVG